MLVYSNLFPSLVGDIFCRGVQHICVSRSILSTASMIADHRLQRPMDRSKVQYITTIQLIQSAIREERVDEGLAIAVFLIAWGDAISSRFESCRKHIRGFYLVLQQIDKNRQTLNSALQADPPGGPRQLRVSRLIMLIWRIAVRADWIMSFYSGKPPVLPSIPAAEELNLPWVIMSTSGDAVEWAMASFALDNLSHKACRYGSQICTIWGKKDYTPDTQRNIRSLARILDVEVQDWRNHPIIQRAESIEKAAQLSFNMSSSDAHSFAAQTFLHHPRLLIINHFYANTLMFWHAISIYVSLMQDPEISATQLSPARVDHAIEICRTLAALQDVTRLSPSVYFPMFCAQIGFGGRHRLPGETDWVVRKCAELATLYPHMRESMKVYESLLDVKGNFWVELGKALRRLGWWWTDSE